MRRIEARGASIPALGFGTWQLRDGLATAVTREALAAGHRHVDTARMYGNEVAVGLGVRESGVPRDEIWVTTKIWPDDFREGDLRAAAEDSLRALDLDRLDLILLHWPAPEIPLSETIPALCALAEAGLTRHVGVSNFSLSLIGEAERHARCPLVCNQVEAHPYLDQTKLRDGMGDMAMVAYSPIAKGTVMDDPALREIGAAHDTDAVGATLAWHLAKGTIPIPRSSKVERVVAALDALTITLTQEEVARIDALARPDGRMVEMEGLAPEWD